MIRAHARIFGGGQAPPTFRALAGSIIDQFDLIELQLDRRLASEHGDDDADLVLFDVDLVDRSDEGGQRAVVGRCRLHCTQPRSHAFQCPAAALPLR